MKICLSISTQVRQPHFLRRPQRWWLPLHRSSSWHSDHRAYQEGYPKSFKVTCVGGTDYRTLSYHVRSAPPTFHYHITLGLPLLRSRRASFCFVAQCSSLRPPHPVTQKTCQSQFTWSTVAKCANGIPSSTPITTDPSKGSAEQTAMRYHSRSSSSSRWLVRNTCHWAAK